jgi:hypothetical protein
MHCSKLYARLGSVRQSKKCNKALIKLQTKSLGGSL